ncbi:MAG: PH domain-containing protein [Chloroflexota bacterium]
MSVNETDAKIRARIWQAIAQSELDLSGIDKATLESLVQLVSESALVEMDDEIGKSISTETVFEKSAAVEDDDEHLLWQGRPFLSITLYYKITDERILISEGLFGKTTENIELIRIQDVAHKQSFGERLINVGDVIIKSHDTTQPSFVLKNVSNPDAVHEILRKAVLAARQKHNFSYREEM